LFHLSLAGTGKIAISLKLLNFHSRMFRRAGRDETKLPYHETIFRFSSRYPETGNP
jgi:hypothetical protein